MSGIPKNIPENSFLAEKVFFSSVWFLGTVFMLFRGTKAFQSAHVKIHTLQDIQNFSNLILVRLSLGAKLVTFHGNLPYTSSEIIKQLELLDEDDVVGSGGFGTVYKMMMDDSSVFAVKRIDRNHDGSDQIFERELEILGSIKHINLVNLRGYCRLPSAKLLIYDYVALGSLDQYLHGKLLQLCFLSKNYL